VDCAKNNEKGAKSTKNADDYRKIKQLLACTHGQERKTTVAGDIGLNAARDGVEKRLRFSTKTILIVDPVPVISRVPRLIILKWGIWNSIQENFQVARGVEPLWPGTGFTNALHS